MRLTQEEQANLKALLLSPDDNNTALALELLPARDFPREVLTEVFVIYKLSKEEHMRRQASAYLHHHPFSGLVHVMNSNLQLGQTAYLQPTEQTIKKNIDTYVALSQGALDGLRLAKAMYTKYGLALKYLLERLPVAERVELLRTFVKGTEFRLADSSLTTVPKELYDFKELTLIDLSRNRLKTVPSRIKEFVHLEELHLSNNNLTSLTKSLKQLPRLRVLDISHNKFKQFPLVVTQLAALETLNVAHLNHLLLGETMTMPADIQQLRHLRQLCLNDNLASYSQGLVLNYNQFPNLSEVTAPPGEVLDLAPLALAEYAYRQNGKSEGVLYLFTHSKDAQLIERIIREQFYDQSSQTLNLKSTMLLRLPQELKALSIRNLQLQNAYLGTEHYVLGTKNAYREWALHDQTGIDRVFSALEGQSEIVTANLSRNRLQYLPKIMCSWTKLRHLDLSQNVFHQLPNYWQHFPQLEILDLRNNHLEELEENFDDLQNLRILYLNNNQLKHLPRILGRLPKLEELYLVNALAPTSGKHAPIQIPSEWAGLCALKKLHLYEPSIHKASARYSARLKALLPSDCMLHLAYA